MPTQKTITAKPDNASQVSYLFALAQALVLDGWGATVRANLNEAVLTTNAPMAFIKAHSERLLVPNA